MLNIQYGEGRCRALLHLLFQEMDPSRVYHIDHLHPKTDFEGRKLKKLYFLGSNEDLFKFYSDPAHWNSIAKLIQRLPTHPLVRVITLNWRDGASLPGSSPARFR
jgi:hypothetical protein